MIWLHKGLLQAEQKDAIDFSDGDRKGDHYLRGLGVLKARASGKQQEASGSEATEKQLNMSSYRMHVKN